MSSVGDHSPTGSVARRMPPTWTLANTRPSGAAVSERVSGGPPHGGYQSARPGAPSNDATNSQAPSATRASLACAVPTRTPSSTPRRHRPVSPSTGPSASTSSPWTRTTSEPSTSASHPAPYGAIAVTSRPVRQASPSDPTRPSAVPTTHRMPLGYPSHGDPADPAGRRSHDGHPRRGRAGGPRRPPGPDGRADAPTPDPALEDRLRPPELREPPRRVPGGPRPGAHVLPQAHDVPECP